MLSERANPGTSVRVGVPEPAPLVLVGGGVEVLGSAGAGEQQVNHEIVPVAPVWACSRPVGDSTAKKPRPLGSNQPGWGEWCGPCCLQGLAAGAIAVR